MTLAQRRVLIAFMRLVDALLTLSLSKGRCPESLDQWLWRHFDTRLPCDLTPAQCRHACRQLNAWRYSIDGGTTT